MCSDTKEYPCTLGYIGCGQPKAQEPQSFSIQSETH